MSYRIVYGNDIQKSGGHLRLWLFAGGFLICFLVGVIRFWPEGRELLLELLLPGDRNVTSQALACMIQNLQSGESIGNALLAFCREILSGYEYV